MGSTVRVDKGVSNQPGVGLCIFGKVSEQREREANKARPWRAALRHKQIYKSQLSFGLLGAGIRVGHGPVGWDPKRKQTLPGIDQDLGFWGSHSHATGKTENEDGAFLG
jgi:hypothetical protein